ncbi:MAG: metal-sensing transcriptional repressor [Proteobacteria bacterium]|nr:metal-sensing transcriptional repressor [Pseudomonadota bacterium]MBQ4358902.1 metal-sensing transcriptional repressor [Pseudomonadota bacterium]
MCENIDLHPQEQCQCKHKHRSENERKTMINRLRRIEGQVRGLEKMVENDAYCTDIVTQVSAVQAALNAFSKQLLANHIQTCVIQDIRSGKDEVVEDLIHTIHKLMK